MLAGVPVLAATWYVQRASQRAYTATPTFTPGGTPSQQGTLATLAVKASPLLNWRRVWLGGAVAVGVFTAAVVGYMATRALGIGPAGSLLAAGKMDAGEALVVSDFTSPPSDSTLGATLAEALRTDLRQSGAINVMTRATMGDVLTLMQQPRDTTIAFDLARQIATREGARALLDGNIVRLGNSYVISARLVSGADGAELANFSSRAADDDDLMRSLGGLSKSIRARIGESLKAVQETKPLERVTTASLPALRKYVEAVRQTDELGNMERGLALLEEAVALDSTFAMAWRKLAVVVGNMIVNRPREIEAAARAYRHRDRLSEIESLLTEAYYYDRGPVANRERALAAYETILERDSLHPTALNNAALTYQDIRQYAKAADRLRLSLNEKRPYGSAFSNLIMTQLRLGRVSAAESTHREFVRRLPAHEELWFTEWLVHWGKGELDAGDSILRSVATRGTQVGQRAIAAFNLAGLSYLRGRIREGIKWRTESRLSAGQLGGQRDLLLAMTLDSAFDAAVFSQNNDRARAIVRRGLSRVSMAEIPAASRPWKYLGLVAALTRDAGLAREAQAGYQRDMPNVGSPTPVGDSARMRGYVALASGEYDRAIAEFRVADREFAINERQALMLLADAFDLSGQRDSAMRYFELFVRTPDLLPFENGVFVASAHKRLAELYEAAGDSGKAEAHYQLFIDLWRTADPELQPTVQSARNRLLQLQSRRG
jgi:tetratricopeptide (TPR) repeat protein